MKLADRFKRQTRRKPVKANKRRIKDKPGQLDRGHRKIMRFVQRGINHNPFK